MYLKQIQKLLTQIKKYTTFINRFSNPLILYKPDKHTHTTIEIYQSLGYIGYDGNGSNCQMEIVRIAKKGNSSTVRLMVELFPICAIR